MAIKAREADKVKDSILVATFEANELSKGQKGAVTGALNAALGGDKNRYLVLWWLFRSGEPGEHAIEVHARDLKDEEWWGLWTWVNFGGEEGEGWQPDPVFVVESGMVLAASMKEELKRNPDAREKYDEELVAHVAAYMGGEVITVSGNGGETWPDTRGVDLPEYKPSAKPTLDITKKMEL